MNPEQRDDTPWEEIVAQALNEGRAAYVSLPAVLAIVAVTLAGGALVLINVFLVWASTLGPDSCDEATCGGDDVLALIFLLLAAVGGLATVGTWFTALSTRRRARYVLSFFAIGVPLIFDLIALAGAPDWLV